MLGSVPVGRPTCSFTAHWIAVSIRGPPDTCVKGIAPAALRVGWFCGPVKSVGVYVVVMGYEDGAYTCQELVEKEHIEQLQIAIKALHEEDYVHGDIRGPNILITTGGLKLRLRLVWESR